MPDTSPTNIAGSDISHTHYGRPALLTIKGYRRRVQAVLVERWGDSNGLCKVYRPDLLKHQDISVSLIANAKVYAINAPLF